MNFKGNTFSSSPGHLSRVMGSETKAYISQGWCYLKPPHILPSYYVPLFFHTTTKEKAMAPHSRTLAWKIPWADEPGRLQSMGSWGSDTTEQLPFHFSRWCIGEGNGNPLQCSCLENPRDGGAWWAAIYGVTQGHTRLEQLSSNHAEKDMGILQSLFLFKQGWCSFWLHILGQVIFLLWVSIFLSEQPL